MFSYQPLSLMVQERIAKEKLSNEQHAILQPMLSMLTEVAKLYQKDKEVVSDAIAIIKNTGSELNHAGLQFYFNELAQLLEIPLASALWFGLECAEKGFNTPILEREYHNFLQQEYTHIGILYLYTRIFEAITPEACMTFLKAMCESMVDRDASVLDHAELVRIKAQLYSSTCSKLYTHAASGDISFAKMLYVVSDRLFAVFDFMGHKIIEMRHFHDMRSLSHEQPIASTQLSSAAHWYYQDLASLANTETATDNLDECPNVMVKSQGKAYQLSTPAQSIMDELLENFDLLYLSKGELHRTDTVELVEFLNEVLVCDVMDNVVRVEMIKGKANAWYIRMAYHYVDTGEDVIVEQVMFLLASLVSVEVFYEMV
jgi:hypothetical protein